MILHLSAPGKCFLAGEYFVLQSGRALVLNLQPRFEMHLESRGAGSFQGIHPQSPAGRLVQKSSGQFKKVNVKFDDPHGGQGGLGASSAQFLMTYVLQKIMSGGEPNLRHPDFGKELLQSYWQCSKTETGQNPSGADLLAQWKGGLALVDRAAGTARSLDWGFADHTFFVIRTGQKVETHRHLEQLPDHNFMGLEQHFRQVEAGLNESDVQMFAEGLNLYQEALNQMGLLAETTSVYLDQLKKSQLFDAVKGCGAMGADLILAVFAKSKVKAVVSFLNQLGLQVVASHEDLSPGLLVKVMPNKEITRGPWL